jgi:hypothetical protein
MTRFLADIVTTLVLIQSCCILPSNAAVVAAVTAEKSVAVLRGQDNPRSLQEEKREIRIIRNAKK